MVSVRDGVAVAIESAARTEASRSGVTRSDRIMSSSFVSYQRHHSMTVRVSHSRLPLASLRLPRNRPALDLLEQHRGDQAEDADGHDPYEHDVDLQQLPRVPDQVADAALGGDELGRHQHDERDRQRDA